MTALFIILSAAVLCGLTAAAATFALRFPAEDIRFAGEDIIIRIRHCRLPVYCRMTVRVSDGVSGSSGEIKIKVRLTGEDTICIASGAKPGTSLHAGLFDVRARAAGFPFYKRFKGTLSCDRTPPPAKKVTLSKRDEASAAGAPEGVREFAHGDRLRDLHMKLSAKCGKYMVRERSGNMYSYSVTETVRTPVSGGRPAPEYAPQPEKTTPGAVVCAAAAAMLWLMFLQLWTGRLPVWCCAFAALLMILYTAGRIARRGGIFRTVFCLLTVASGAAGALHLTSQLGRVVNLISGCATARYDRIFPLVQSGRHDIFAACFLTALAVWTISAAALSRHRLVRYLAAAVMISPAVLLCTDSYAAAAAVAAGLLAAAPWRGFGLRGSIIPAVSAAAACAVFCSSAGGYVVSSAGRAAETARFGGSITQPAGRIADIPQPGGDTPALEVVMDKPEAMYLHGFTGCEYVDGCWSAPHSDGLSVGQGSLKALYDNGFTADAQPLLLLKSGSSSADTQSVSVRTLNAFGRYAYIPDGAYVSGNRYPAGLEVPARGSTVTFEAVTDIFSAADRFDSAVNAADGDYLGCAAVTDKIYREDYTSVPDSAERVLEAQLGVSRAVTADEAAELIYRLLDGCQFDPAADPQTAEDFIQTTRCGNSCAYASAAVLAFRYFGIPARYAEGYALTKDAAAKAAAGSAVSLTADDFHAWAEYYIEGAGWLPFETVPAYLDKMPHTRAQGEAVKNSGYGTAKGAADEQSGGRVYSRQQDEDKPESRDVSYMVFPAAAAALILVYLAYLLIRLESDPLYALSKCAAHLGLAPDTAGRYDTSRLAGRTKQRLEQLEKLCIERVYSPGRSGRAHGAAAYLSCLTCRRKA